MLVVKAKKLLAYFESHPVVVYTSYPMKQIFHKLDKSERMLKWSIVLCGLDITFICHTIIKAQAIADFLTEHSFLDTTATPEEEPKSIKLDT